MSERLVRAQGRVVFPQETLKKKSGDKPAGSVVKADHLGQIPAGTLIIPGTQLVAVQPYAGEKFTGEDQAGIGEAAKQQGAVSDQAAEGSEQSSHTVDGKHPDGGGAGECEIPSAKGVKSREGDL